MSAQSILASKETLAEAVAIARFASDDARSCVSWDEVELALADADLASAILAVAGHVCDLRGRGVPMAASIAGRPGMRRM